MHAESHVPLNAHEKQHTDTPGTLEETAILENTHRCILTKRHT